MKQEDELYYDAMDELMEGNPEEAVALLKEALALDKNYVQTYVGLVSAYGMERDDRKRIEATKKGFEITKKDYKKWPKEMLWGYMENRAHLRAIQYMADLYWDNGEDEKAIELFKLLLRLNPGDNQGVRYELAALYAGKSGRELNNMFDKGNTTQNWDDLEKMLAEQNKKHKFWGKR